MPPDGMRPGTAGAGGGSLSTEHWPAVRALDLLIVRLTAAEALVIAHSVALHDRLVAGALLDRVHQLVLQQLVPGLRPRPVLGASEDDLIPDGEGLGPDLARGGGGIGVVVHAHGAEIVVEPRGP